MRKMISNKNKKVSYAALAIMLQNILLPVQSKIEFDEEGDIDETLNGLKQDDPYLVDVLKDYYLMSPSSGPYQIDKKFLRSPLIDGQFKQARIVDLFYNESKTDGFFFEAGAYDGVSVSNTLLFETLRNWKGLLVEANPDNYDQLLTHGRKAYSFGNCLSMKETPEVIMFDATTIFGGILREGVVKPGDNIPSNDRENQKKSFEGLRRTIKMQCFPIYSMLLAVGNPVVDYMSLDIEGTEYDVLKSIPWNKVDIRIISIEVTIGKLDETAQGEHLNYWPQIQEFMKSINYTLVRADWHTPERISLEAYFVKNELAEKIVDKTEKQNLLRGSYNTKYPFL